MEFLSFLFFFFKENVKGGGDMYHLNSASYKREQEHLGPIPVYILFISNLHLYFPLVFSESLGLARSDAC